MKTYKIIEGLTLIEDDLRNFYLEFKSDTGAVANINLNRIEPELTRSIIRRWIDKFIK